MLKIDNHLSIEQCVINTEVGALRNNLLPLDKCSLILSDMMRNQSPGDFPGSLVIKSLHFHCRGSWVQSLVRELRSCKPGSSKNKPKKKKKTSISAFIGTTSQQVMSVPLVLKGVQFSSVPQSCPTFCNPMNRSTPGLPIHHQPPESTQTHVQWVGDAIQPSHPLSSPSPSALNLSQHQGLFQWVSSSHQVAKVLELQHQSFQ